MTEILQALRELTESVSAATTEDDAWRWRARQQLSKVRELLSQVPNPSAPEVAARSLATYLQRQNLMARIGALGPRITSSVEVDTVAEDVRRLVSDLVHHVQRVNDLAWDAVELELGGSE